MGTSAWPSTFTVAVRWSKIRVILRFSTSRGSLNRTDVYPWNHEEMVLSGRAAILEGEIILVLGERVRPGIPLRALYVSHLEDNIETLLRRCPTEDALCHRLAKVRRGGPEARHDEREGGNPTSYNKKKRGKPRICDRDQRHRRKTFRVTCKQTARSKQRGYNFGDSRNCSPDGFARRCGWHPAADHPLNSHAT